MFLTGASLLCAHGAARAQAISDAPRQLLTISLGTFNENRRDEADSPLAYAGTGVAERIDYIRSRGRRRWYFSLEGGSTTIAPVAAGLHGQSEEGFGAYTIGAGTDWRLGGSSRESGAFAVGVQFAGTLTVARHLYANQDLTEQTFDFAIVTLAPAARWTHSLGSGQMTASLAMPLLAWVDRPFADVRYANQFVDFHYASPAQLRQVDGVLSYTFNPQSRYEIMAAYRINAMEFNELQPVRRVTQSFSLAVTRIFGALP